MVQTVNVIQYINNAVSSIHSYADTPEGNKEAETLFTRLVEEHEDTLDMNYIGQYIEDGVYDDECGYQAFLVHSEGGE